MAVAGTAANKTAIVTAWLEVGHDSGGGQDGGSDHGGPNSRADVTAIADEAAADKTAAMSV
jgi:hypothetical protein